MRNATTAARLVLGGYLAVHGAQKLFGLFGGHGVAGTAKGFGSLGAGCATPRCRAGDPSIPGDRGVDATSTSRLTTQRSATNEVSATRQTGEAPPRGEDACR